MEASLAYPPLPDLAGLSSQFAPSLLPFHAAPLPDADLPTSAPPGLHVKQEPEPEPLLAASSSSSALPPVSVKSTWLLSSQTAPKGTGPADDLTCRICGKTFKRKSDRCRHERCHSDIRPYSCSFCSKSFHRPFVRTRHERLHTGERPYVCQYCGKAFPYKESKLSHERIHTGERPYACDVCGMTFRSMSTRERHRHKHVPTE